MKLVEFDHVNVKTDNLQAMVSWYDDILGMKTGPRPNFPFPGAWLYLGEKAIIHLVATDEAPRAIDPKIEHFAISATGLKDFLVDLESRGIDVKIAEIEDFGIIQVNIFDPDGNHIHIDFDWDERSSG